MTGGQHLHWGAEALWQRLGPQLPGLSVEVVAQVESTNTALIERARRSGGLRDAPISQPGEFDPTDDPRTPHGRRSGDTQPCLLVAEHQTRGRGRQGRAWQSAPGASLTFSLALPFAPANWSGLSLAVGVALADALDPLSEGGAALIGLKWPNDLWLTGAGDPGRKLGGVLIETLPVGDRRMCIVGIGLNVLPQQFEDLSSGYACWQEIDPHATAPSVLAAVAEPLVRALRRFEREGFAAFAAAYSQRDLLRGRTITTTQPGVPEGVADGIDASGAMRVRVDGVVHALVAGEVSVRPAGSGTTTC
jgi:BirA family transcriptional regulator, biotin operon repressor / biotin---[acetyl-CoA-carboxylase] ligase